MAAKKSTRHRHRHRDSSSPFASEFQTLVASVKSPQDLKSPILKHLYLLLVQLSLDENVTQNGTCLKFKQLLDFFDILFEELESRFKQACGEEEEVYVFVEELCLLLRCCMISLNLIAADQKLLIEKGRAVFLVLRKLLSREMSEGRNGESILRCKKKVTRKQTCVDDDNCSTSVTSISFLRPSTCSLIEVVADELLVHKSLKSHFILIDFASSNSERLYSYHFGDDKVGCVLELISAHFILSVSDEKGLENFIDLLFWRQSTDVRTFEISLPAVLTILFHPIILSVPKTFQTYLICLVSEVMNCNNGHENNKPDIRHMNYYLTALERSVFLYTRHLTNLNVDKGYLTRKFSFVNVGSGFDSCLQPATRNKVFHTLDNLNKSSSFEKNSDLVASSISYAKDCANILDNSCKDQILSILSCIVLQASDDSTSGVEKENIILEDMYFLASILKLMSCSLKHVLSCMSCNKGLESQTPLSQEYEVLLSIISCFKQFDTSLPVQKFILDKMEGHKESKWMLLHLSGLLSLSIASGLDFLVKGCIFALINLLNLLFIEEGNLEAFESTLNSRSVFSPSKCTAQVGEAPAGLKSSKKVASKFQKMRTLHTRTSSLRSSRRKLRDDGASPSENTSDLDDNFNIEDKLEEACSRETFLKCLGVKNLELEGIEDFIECKPGRDYSEWLKGRRSYQRWKQGKTAALMKKKKKKIWKLLKEMK
ncbi:hypothetical protein ACFE04_004317 [Oxalis oulophora]